MVQPLIDEEQFKAITCEKYRNHFDHVFRLHQLAEESLLNYKGFAKNHHQGALVLIFPRAYKSFDSIRWLCEVARCEDTAVILRCLLNLLVVTRWIELKPSSRARKYFAWYWVEMKREAEQLRDQIPAAHGADIQRNFMAIKSQFEYKDRKGRTKMARHWYEPEASTIFELFKEVGLEKQYEGGYRPLSGIEHSNAMAFFAMLAQSETQENERKLLIQSDLFVPAYLRNAFQYFADIFRICNKTIALIDGNKLEETIDAGMRFYATDMQARGIPTT